MNQAVTCRLCGGRTQEFLGLAHAKVYQCMGPGCGLRFASPQLADLELSAAYRQSYYPEESGKGHEVYESTPAAVLNQVLATLLPVIGGARGRRLLDFGCGPGDLSQLALGLGLRPTGIEFDPVARRRAGEAVGVSVYQDLDALERNEPEASFELAALWEVIEHLREPWTELARIRRRMKPGGSLILSTPNAACLKARVQGVRWSNYANPTHFYYFTHRSLISTLRAAGFIRIREWLLAIQYPGHGILRRAMHSQLVRMHLHGSLLFTAENPSVPEFSEKQSGTGAGSSKCGHS